MSPRVFGGVPRSPHWDDARDDQIRRHPECLACGSKRNLEAHHLLPYHLYPRLELDPKNLVTLCRVCHFIFGHLKSWSSYNPNCIRDSLLYRKAIRNRPKPKPKEGRAMFIINDQTDMGIVQPDDKSRGLVPRNYSTHPSGFYAGIPQAAIDMPVLSKQEIIDRVKYRQEIGATNRQIRRNKYGKIIPSLDQNGIGYCWCHSPVTAMIFIRAIMNQPYVSLSPFMVGCLVKNYQDRGGWGADAVDFIIKNGVPSEEFWPQRSMKRSNDTPAMRENAALHKITEGWIDYAVDVWDRNMTHQQHLTWLALGGCVVADRNWWGHSTLDYDLEIVDGEPCPVTWNEWGDNWGDQGESVIQGNRAYIDGGVGIRVVTPASV